VDGEPEVGVAVDRDLPRVNPHPDADACWERPVVGDERTFAGDSRADRLARAVEDDEERVALRVHLAPAVLRERTAEDALVLGDQIAVVVAKLPSRLVDPSMSVKRRVIVLLDGGPVTSFSCRRV